MHRLINPLVVILTFFCICTSALGDEKKTYPLHLLHNHGDALNIEGGLIPLYKLKPHQIWVNLGIVLDKPFEDGIDYNEWKKKNKYKLKETSFPNYNESLADYTYATLLKYYIDEAHTITNKPSSEPVKIIVHIHRGKSGPAHIALLEKLLTKCFYSGKKSENLSSSLHPKIFNNAIATYRYPGNTIIEYRYGSGLMPEIFGNFDNADIVISLSLVAGFNPNIPSGSIVVPTTFIPFTLFNMQLRKDLQYSVPNHLAKAIPKLVKSQDPKVINIINKLFRSENRNKGHLVAKRLTKGDFKIVTILQADGLFNAKLLPQTFEVIEPSKE